MQKNNPKNNSVWAESKCEGKKKKAKHNKREKKDEFTKKKEKKG